MASSGPSFASPDGRPRRAAASKRPDYAGNTHKRQGALGVVRNSSGANQHSVAAAAAAAAAQTATARKKRKRGAHTLDIAHKCTKAKDKKLKARDEARREAMAEADVRKARQRVQLMEDQQRLLQRKTYRLPDEHCAQALVVLALQEAGHQQDLPLVDQVQ